MHIQVSVPSCARIRKLKLRYIQLEQAIYANEPESFISRVAKTVEEARQLVESGFEYVCDMEGVKLFRKRK